jgi:catalase
LPIITEDGNWDLVGNTPVFSSKTARNLVILFTLKKGTPYNMKSPTMMWDFWSLNPESLHQVLILMSDRGTYGYRHERLWQSYLFDAGRSEPAHLCEVSFQNSAGNQEF